MKILISGFEPFGNETINASWQAVSKLPDAIGGHSVIKVLLPVSFKSSFLKLHKEILTHEPDAVICVGQASGRSVITPEKIGINWMDARIPDNDGNCPKGEKIADKGADGQFSRLPVEAMVQAMKENDVPAQISYTAGTYVCNYLMYSCLYDPKLAASNTPVGFIHVPATPKQVLDQPNVPSMSADLIAKGLEAAIGVLLEHSKGKGPIEFV